MQTIANNTQKLRKKEKTAEIGENQQNQGIERKLRETGFVTKGFALAELASM